MKKTVLVVDDSEFTRSYHSHILYEAGFDVLTAIDGCDGLEKLFSNSCDLILTDINMERMDGYEFIRRTRAEPRYHHLPIVIVSTQRGQTDRMKGFEAGANLYLVKPCSAEAMVENIRLILAGSWTPPPDANTHPPPGPTNLPAPSAGDPNQPNGSGDGHQNH